MSEQLVKCRECQKYIKCAECKKQPKESCEECRKCLERMQRNSDMFCKKDQMDLCSRCAALYHKGCDLCEINGLVELCLEMVQDISSRSTVEVVNKYPLTCEKIVEYLDQAKKKDDANKLVAEEIKKNVTDKVDSTSKGLTRDYEGLTRQLTEMDEKIKTMQASIQDREAQLEDFKHQLPTLRDDPNFGNVLQIYRRIRDMKGDAPGSAKREVDLIEQQLKKFQDNQRLSSISNDAKRLFDSSQRKAVTCFQEYRNLVYLFSSYGISFYTYDVDTRTPAVYRLIDEKNQEFKMWFNVATVLHRNRIFFLGGTDTLEECGSICHVFSFLTKIVRPIPAMTLCRREHSAVYCKGCVYVVGGRTGDGLTAECEKLPVDTAGTAIKDEWVDVRKLNYARSAISLCCFDEKRIYAIGGLCNDKSACFIERLAIGFDVPDKSLPACDAGRLWEPVCIEDPDRLYEHHQIIGSFGYRSAEGTPKIVVFCGGETKEKSVAYECPVGGDGKLTMRKIECPNLAGTGNFYDRAPLYTNGGKDVYVVGFHDILHFRTEEGKWVDPVPGASWVTFNKL